MCKVCLSTNGRGEADPCVLRWKAPGLGAGPTADDRPLHQHPQAMTTKDLNANTEDDYTGYLPPFSPPKKPPGPLSEEEQFELIAKWQAGGLTLDTPRTSAVTDVTVKHKSVEDRDTIVFETSDELTTEEKAALYDLYAMLDDEEHGYRLEDDDAAPTPMMEGEHHFFFYDDEEYAQQNLCDEVCEAEGGTKVDWDPFECSTDLYAYGKENGGVWYTTDEDGYHQDQGFEEEESDESTSMETHQQVSSGYLSAEVSCEQFSPDDSTQLSDNIYIPKGWEKFPREILKQKFDLKKDPALPSLKEPALVEEPTGYRRARSANRAEDQLGLSLADEIMQAEGIRSSCRGSRRHKTSREHNRPRIVDLRRRRDSGPIPGSARMPSLRDKLEEYEMATDQSTRPSEPPSRRTSLTTQEKDMISVAFSHPQGESGADTRRKRSAHRRCSRREQYGTSAAATPRSSRPSTARSQKHRQGKDKDSTWNMVAIAGCVIAIGVLIWGLCGQRSTKITPIIKVD